MTLLFRQVFSFLWGWCCSLGWVLLRWRCRPSLWFCPPFYSNGNELFVASLSPVIFAPPLLFKFRCATAVCLCAVTQSPALSSWRPNWVTSGGRRACQKSVSTSAWALCAARPPNSVCWTASSTTAVPPSTLCALTSIR